MDTEWYRNAVIYSLDVRTFQDSDGDGIGDFRGLMSRLDYLANVGVTALWLQPFFPTPFRDAGYDVSDYMDVAADLGGLPAFLDFSDRASEMGLRLIVDLPLNHTSVDHPWFQQARTDRESPYRDYYIWEDEPPATSPEQIVFSGDEPSPWTYDDEAGQYYLHRFYAHQPDLNHANPDVRREVLSIARFWMKLGASGIRIDAAPYLAKKSAADPGLEGPHDFLRELHRCVVAERPDAMLLAEADVALADLQGYFGDGDEMQMMFNFMVNNYYFLALARQRAEPLTQVLGMLPHRPPGGTWANWVRNHDELDLERLSTPERDDVMAAFAPDEDMRVYGRGIRRRLPPMVDGDRRRMELAYSLLMALPGTPIVRYGEEIGMGDDLSLPERDAVRTPMQWSPVRNGGFSTAPEDALLFPVIDEGPFGIRHVSVSQQQVERDSFFARMQLIIGVRRQTPEIGWQEPEVIESGHPAVLGLLYRQGAHVVVVLHNLAEEDAELQLDALSTYDFGHDILADRAYDRIDSSPWTLSVAGYGYRWFRATDEEQLEHTATTQAAQDAMRRGPT